MIVETTPIDDLLILTPARYGDARGWFSETWNRRRMEGAGLDYSFVQDNQSFSAAQHTLRGLHYQAPPHAQAKLVQCLQGAIWDVAVDVREGSNTFGQWHGVELSAENGRQFLIPDGFLHGFVTLSANALIQYKCSGFYAPDHEGGVLWSSLDIDWKGVTTPFLSDKDAHAPEFSAWQSPFVRRDLG
ncbi:MAG: dTDP-4-dehydrorhamnose 3,5-epimerase [Pseudomonadota bacterium]